MIRYLRQPWTASPAMRWGTSDASGTVALVVNGAHGDVIDFVSPSGTLRARQHIDGRVPALAAGRLSRGERQALPRADLGHPIGQMISISDSDGTTPARATSPTTRDSGPSRRRPIERRGAVRGRPGHGAIRADAPRGAHVRRRRHAGARALGAEHAPSSGTVFGLAWISSVAHCDHRRRSRFGGGTTSAQWFDKDGGALTGEFVFLTGFSPEPHLGSRRRP